MTGQQRFARGGHQFIRLNTVPLQHIAAVARVVGERVLKAIAVGKLRHRRGQRRARGRRADHVRPAQIAQALREDFTRRA